MKILKDMLTEKQRGYAKYSQGRVYLFASFVAFFISNLLLVYYALTGIEIKNTEALLLFSTNIKWALSTFALYVLGDKGIGIFRKQDPDPSSEESYWGKNSNNNEDEDLMDRLRERDRNRQKPVPQKENPTVTKPTKEEGDGFYPSGDEQVN